MRAENLSFERKITYAFYMLLLITLPFKLMNGETEKIFSIFLTLLTTLFVNLLFSKTKIKITKEVYFLVILFIFLSMYLGKIINFYRFFPNWDKFLHLTSGPILTVIGYIIYLNLINKSITNKINPAIGILFALFFSIASAGIWEVFEFMSDSIFGLNAQNGSLLDTMWDIICGSSGGGLMALLMYIPLKKKQIPFFTSMMKGLEENLVKDL